MNRQRPAVLALTALIATLVHARPALADLNAGLVAYYPFNGNANDESGNGNDGTVVGAVLAADRFGAPDGAYLFTNNPEHGAMAADYVAIVDSSSLRPQTGLTLAAWINTSNPAGRSIVGKHFGAGVEDSYLLWYNVGTLWFTLFPFGSASVNAPIPALGAWHHVAGTWDGSAIRLYVDGKEVASGAFAGPMQYDGNPVVIGADNDDGDTFPDDGWDGLIDDVRIYSRALSADEIREMVRGCTLELTSSYVGNTLHLNFKLGTLDSATSNLWIVVQNATFIQWSVPIPTIDPPVAFSVPIPGIPHLGVVGFLTTMSTGAGIICSDWETVDTGQ